MWLTVIIWSPEEVIDVVGLIEATLDSRVSFYQHRSDELLEKLGRNSDGKVVISEFLSCLTETPFGQPLLQFLQMLEDDTILPLSDIQMINFAQEGEFSQNLSPISVSSHATPLSDLSYDGIDPLELSSHLDSIMRSEPGFEEAEGGRMQPERVAERFGGVEVD